MTNKKLLISLFVYLSWTVGVAERIGVATRVMQNELRLAEEQGLIGSDRLGMPLYVVDTIEVLSPVGLFDKKSGFYFIKGEGIRDFESAKGKSPAELLSQGWALADIEGYFELSAPLRSNPMTYKIIYTHYINATGTEPITLEESDDYVLYRINPPADTFLLIMIKGSAFNKYMFEEAWDVSPTPKINFKDPDSYYPMLFPLYRFPTK